ncbi:MAG: class I SAM-dependent methyltransferase [Candidatus Uhrbacteria bacterium]|nr:class I SAM-dependent methyltransferase [Patescibacteria group bacterium]MBU1906948.1 class I SAM-dependent methyltransferase [Patescibacteria group bacterium]
MDINEVTKDYIKNLSYTDFVGFVNQWNVLPGSYVTLSKWAVFSKLDAQSKLLEVACTTGFSSRELAMMTGCSGEGFDLSEKSVAMAKYNQQQYAPEIDFTYQAIDGYKYEPNTFFSHILVGASLGFFPDPQAMLDKCISMLKDGGFILASPFYVTSTIPDDLIKRAQKVFEITPTSIPYKEIMKLYNKLEIIFEERNDLVQETDAEINCYCKSTIDRACAMRGIADQGVYQAMYDRLFEVKKMSNDLRPHQMYSVLVLRYRRAVYPNRFVELF